MACCLAAAKRLQLMALDQLRRVVSLEYDAVYAIFWGTADLTLIRGWKRHFEVLPDVPLHLLPGLGHVSMVDDGRTIADCIRRSARA